MSTYSAHRERRPHSNAVAEVPFAGRIGAFQQEFEDDEKGQETLKSQPDAAPLFSLRDSLHPGGFLVLDNWKMAAVEGVGTCLLVFAVGAAASGLTTSRSSPMAISLYASLINTLGLSLFIFTAAPVSGGHLNPSITMATFFAGLSTLPRSILYIVAQTTGAIIGGYWLKLGLGDMYFPVGAIPGCTVDPDQISAGQLFALEYMFALSLIFLAFGVGLDPRQARTLGPALSPILVGVALGFATLASSVAKPGYTGVSFNPARCMGLMLAKNEMQYHYVHWLGPLAASIMHGVFYYLVPPYVRDRPRREVALAVRNPA